MPLDFLNPKPTDDLHTYRPTAHTPVAARRPRHRDEPDEGKQAAGHSGNPQHRALPIDPYSTADRYWRR